jgi:hypothetical protein
MQALLMDPAIRNDLRVLLISEAGGVETFAAAERFAKNPGERTMWGALHALEVKTRAAVYEHLGEVTAQFRLCERTAELLGQAGGIGLAHLPPRIQLRTLSAGTKAFLPTFERLQNRFRGTDLETFFAFVVAHENAIAEVGRRGLASLPGHLDPVNELLGP